MRYINAQMKAIKHPKRLLLKNDSNFLIRESYLDMTFDSLIYANHTAKNAIELNNLNNPARLHSS